MVVLTSINNKRRIIDIGFILNNLRNLLKYNKIYLYIGKTGIRFEASLPIHFQLVLYFISKFRKYILPREEIS